MKGAIGVGVVGLVALPLTFAGNLVVARALGPEAFGQYAFVTAMIAILAIPGGSALMNLMTRETAKYFGNRDFNAVGDMLRWARRSSLTINLSLIVASSMVVFLCKPGSIDGRALLFLLCLPALPFIGFNAIRSGVLAGAHRVVLAQVVDLLIRPATMLLIGGIIVLTVGLTPGFAVGSFIASALVSSLVGFIILKKAILTCGEVKPSKEKANHQPWYSAWGPFILLVATSTLNTRIGVLMLGWLGGDLDVSGMQVAERCAMLVVLPLMAVNQVISPRIARIVALRERSELQKLSRWSARAALFFALPIALPLLFFSSILISKLFGEDYVGIATSPLIILVVGQVINVAFGSVGRILVMSGYERDSLKAQFGSLILTFMFCIILIPRFGAVGAAWSVVIGLAFWNVALSIRVYKRLKIRPTAFL